MKKKILIVLSVALCVNAQDLKTSVEEILNTNPIILERLKNYNAIKENITEAKAGYYPKLDLSLGMGIESSDKTNQATTQANNSNSFSVYQNSLTYTQNVFKGFETTHRVAAQENRTISAAYSYIEKVNDTSFEMVNTYLQVMRNRALLDTAKENVKIDQEIFEKVKKLYDSGLTTLSEVNKIESSLSLAKSNLIVQENTLLDVSYNLQRVLGRDLNTKEMSKPTLNVVLPTSREEAAKYALEHNPSLLVSKYNMKLAQETYKEKNAPFYPHIDVEVSQSMNHNLNGVEGDDSRFKAMAYLKYNIFNGYADTSARQRSISQMHQEVESKNNLRRQVIEGLNLSWAANKKLDEQLVYLKEYKKFSLKTLTLYAKEYDLGRRSLLDLLSAQNDFIGAKSQIINTQYSMLFAKYRILDAMGMLVPTILGNSDLSFSKVGLSNTYKEELDTMPIHLDRDNDLIVDDKDLCSNSLNTTMKNVYGCEELNNSLNAIERYNGFIFEKKSNELTSDSVERFYKLLNQLKPYGLSYIKLDLLINAQYEDSSTKDLQKMSDERASYMKEIFIKAGILESNITLHSLGDSAPMFVGDEKNNNRVDVIVNKLRK